VRTWWAFLRRLFPTWRELLFIGIPTAIATYDGVSHQLDWPKIPALWGMSGGLLSSSEWGLILLGILMYLLFDYVRRIPASGPSAAPPSVDLTSVESRLVRLEEEFVGDREKISRALDFLSYAVDALAQPLLVESKLERLKGLPEIPRLEKISMGEFSSEGEPSAIASHWPSMVKHISETMADILGDASGDLQKRLLDVAAGIRADSLFSSPTEEEKRAGISGAHKQQWHILRAQFETIRSYLAAQEQELRVKLTADHGAENAKLCLEQAAVIRQE